MSFKNELIKIGSENPDLQKHLRPIIDNITDNKTKGNKTKEAKPQKDLQSLVQGSKIFTVKKREADIIQDKLVENGLYPKSAVFSLESGRGELIIVCEPGHDFVSDFKDSDVEYVAQQAANELSFLGYTVKARGTSLERQNEAVVGLWQEP